jgi:hypothetical protein
LRFSNPALAKQVEEILDDPDGPMAGDDYATLRLSWNDEQALTQDAEKKFQYSLAYQ